MYVRSHTISFTDHQSLAEVVREETGQIKAMTYDKLGIEISLQLGNGTKMGDFEDEERRINRENRLKK